MIPKAVCVHEEDAGMLWKHTDTRLGHVEVRRNRRLVLSQVSTFANYVSVLWGAGWGGVGWLVAPVFCSVRCAAVCVVE